MLFPIVYKVSFRIFEDAFLPFLKDFLVYFTIFSVFSFIFLTEILFFLIYDLTLSSTLFAFLFRAFPTFFYFWEISYLTSLNVYFVFLTVFLSYAVFFAYFCVLWTFSDLFYSLTLTGSSFSAFEVFFPLLVSAPEAKDLFDELVFAVLDFFLFSSSCYFTLSLLLIFAFVSKFYWSSSYLFTFLFLFFV